MLMKIWALYPCVTSPHSDCFNCPPVRLLWRRGMVTNKVVLLMVLTFAVTPFKYLGISVFCPLRLSTLSSHCSSIFISHIQCKHTAFTVIHSLCLALYVSLTEDSDPKPLFTSLPTCILMYICEERGPALLIRSTAPLKRILRERWWYLLLSTCPPCPPTVLVINDVSHIRGALIRHGCSHQTKPGLGARCLTDEVGPMARGSRESAWMLMTFGVDC